MRVLVFDIYLKGSHEMLFTVFNKALMKLK